MTVFRDERSAIDPRFSKRVMDSYEKTGLERTLQTPNLAYALDPDFAELFTQFVRGDMYSRTVLSQAQREIIACCVLSCLDKQNQLRSHLQTGVIRGATREELLEAIIQSVVYGGFPAALTSLQTYAQVFPEMLRPDRPPQPADGPELPAGPIYGPAREMATTLLGEAYADESAARYNRWDPDFAMAAQRLVFGGIYARTVVDLKLRELMAVGCLTVKGALPLLKTHAGAALDHGCSRAEVQEVILQMSVYGGFPAMVLAMQVFEALLRERGQAG